MKLCQLVFYVPETHLELVKQAVFDAGAGEIGDYQHCCWQVAGEGQFRPRPGSNPTIGECNRLEKVVEYRVEMVMPEEKARLVVNALLAAHPYEEPAWSAWPLMKP